MTSDEHHRTRILTVGEPEPRGGYVLQSSKLRGDKRNWLLIKMKDDEADARRTPIRSERASVLSGRTIEEVGAQEVS